MQKFDQMHEFSALLIAIGLAVKEHKRLPSKLVSEALPAFVPDTHTSENESVISFILNCLMRQGLSEEEAQRIWFFARPKLHLLDSLICI